METLNFNIVIIGGGTAGVAAAYALSKCAEKYKVALIEKEQCIGGTAVNALVYDWIQGINPPYLMDICKVMGKQGTCKIRRVPQDRLVPFEKEEDIKYTWLARKFYHDVQEGYNVSSDDGHIFFDPVALSRKYVGDLKDRITIFTNCTLLHSISDNTISESKKKVQSVIVRTGEKEFALTADFFIDSSADGVLCRSVNNAMGTDYYVGLDRYAQYEEDLLLRDNQNFDTQRLQALIEPSMFFAVYKKGTCNSVQNGAKGEGVCKDGYPFPFVGCNNLLICNPMKGLGIDGQTAFASLEKMEQLKIDLIKRIPAYWYEMNNCSTWAANYELPNPVKSALIPGVRETYRIACEYMLSQKDLTINVFDAMETGKGSDFIAVGSHGIDLHNNVGIVGNVSDFNDNKLQPYGIPYGCILPKKLSNVWIACRAFGASHLAFSSARINKVMAQIGWAAGNAARLCLDMSLPSTSLNAEQIITLQGKDFTSFRKTLAIAHCAISNDTKVGK